MYIYKLLNHLIGRFNKSLLVHLVPYLVDHIVLASYDYLKIKMSKYFNKNPASLKTHANKWISFFKMIIILEKVMRTIFYFRKPTCPSLRFCMYINISIPTSMYAYFSDPVLAYDDVIKMTPMD